MNTSTTGRLESPAFLEEYGNKWVALTDDDQVICAGSSLVEVVEEAKRRGVENPVTARIPDSRFEFVL